MSKHKWRKEIKAWADGAKIEVKWKGEKEWWDDDDPEWGNDDCIFRLKPQLVGTQYLYVYVDELWNAKLKGRDELFKGEFGNYIGKIPLMVDSNDANQTEEGLFEQELTEKEKASIQFELTLPAVRELLDLKPLQEPVVVAIAQNEPPRVMLQDKVNGKYMCFDVDSFVQAHLATEQINGFFKAITRHAQEPVAFCKHGVPKGVCTLGEKDCNASPSWQGLSDDEVKGKLFGIRFDRHTHNLMSNPPQIQYSYTITENELFKFARAIEQASKEKNT